MIRRHGPTADRGAILPLVLVVVVVMALVIVALADYSSTTLRYGQVVERSADRFTAAEGAIDNVLEAIDRNASLCTLSTLPNQSGGHTFPLGYEINGIEPMIECRSIGTNITGVEEFSLILTSRGDLNDPLPEPVLGDALINFTEGGFGSQRKVIDGPVYMARPPNNTAAVDTLAFAGQPLRIRHGDLWYSPDTACPDPLAIEPSPLSIGPAGYDQRCVTDGWITLFDAAEPTEPSIGSFGVAPPADITGPCHIWEPGRYTAPPNLSGSDYHYFTSGDYYFDFPGFNAEWAIDNAWVLMGKPGAAGPSLLSHNTQPAPTPHPCAAAWQDDAASIPGATIYLGGPSRIDVGTNGTLEVIGRDRLGDGRRLALQALATQNATTLLNDTPRLIRADSSTSARSRITIDGLVWAPSNSVELRRVDNEATPALRGGAVLGELHIGAPSAATNVLVTPGRTPQTRRLEITATATSPTGGTTEVVAVINYRDGDYALLSRRVRCITPDTPSC